MVPGGGSPVRYFAAREVALARHGQLLAAASGE
jgi:hypothetical protein